MPWPSPSPAPWATLRLPHRPVRLAGEEGVPVLVVTVAVEHRDAAHMLACRVAAADRAHAVGAADQLEAVDGDVAGVLEVEARFAFALAAGHGDAERAVVVALAVEHDRLVVGSAVFLLERNAGLVAAAGEMDQRARSCLRDRGVGGHRRVAPGAVAAAVRADIDDPRRLPGRIGVVAVEFLRKSHEVAAAGHRRLLPAGSRGGVFSEGRSRRRQAQSGDDGPATLRAGAGFGGSCRVDRHGR